MFEIDWSLVAQSVTAIVAAGFALIKAVSGLISVFKKK